MATSNRERVGRGFQLVAVGLAPFVDRMMSAAAGAARDRHVAQTWHVTNDDPDRPTARIPQRSSRWPGPLSWSG